MRKDQSSKSKNWRWITFLAACLAACLASLMSIMGWLRPMPARTQGDVPLIFLPYLIRGDDLLISEVVYRPGSGQSGGEWIELFNPTRRLIDLSLYEIGDAETPGSSEGMFAFPSGSLIQPGQVIVIASLGTDFTAYYGLSPDYELNESDPFTPTLAKDTDWASGRVALADTGDSVILMERHTRRQVDAVSWGDVTFAFSPQVGRVAAGHSLERSPADIDTNTAADWLDQANPDPGHVVLASERSAASSPTDSRTAIPTRTATLTRTATQTRTFTPTNTATLTPTPTSAPTSTRTPTQTRTLTPTSTATLTTTPTSAPTSTRTPTQTRTLTPTNTPSPTSSPTATPPSPPTPTKTTSPTVTSEVTLPVTQTASPTLTGTPTPTETQVATETCTLTPTVTATGTPTSSVPPAPTSTDTPTPSETPTTTPTDTPTPSKTPTATAQATVTSTPTPSATQTASPTPTQTPTSTSAPGVSHLLISEVFYYTPGTPANQQWIEVYNPLPEQVDLFGYKIGNEAVKGGAQGMYRFPSGAVIDPGQKIVVALKASEFFGMYGFKPDYEFNSTDPSVPDLIPYTEWSSGIVLLSRMGDEVVLLNKADQAVDVLVYGTGYYPGVKPHPGVNGSNRSLERYPADQDSDDCSLDFVESFVPSPGY